ncbi:hypothetical protein [Hespellia stercorisuis]|uniref:Uncharacterized protein n=1 Tax=Hespellia stercorisuis DSM 15480 TaxID=1121950 RepID=A0A1M6V9P9_9FIRM|nr:hypothetical protein [Hespellia stercorisuis]SHK78210.1 hypothetical protein SAMN02745243_03717 [Hespellia stercorisuis DSM 15480]
MSFRDELNSVSRTPEEVQKIAQNEEYACGLQSAILDYKEIKEEMLELANSGAYTVLPNGKHQIHMYYKFSSIQADFQLKRTETRVNKTILNRKGSYAYRMYYVKNNHYHYDAYMEKLKELSKNDDIDVRTVGLYDYHNNLQVFDINSGFVGFALLENHFSVCIECKTEY